MASMMDLMGTGAGEGGDGEEGRGGGIMAGMKKLMGTGAGEGVGPDLT